MTTEIRIIKEDNVYHEMLYTLDDNKEVLNNIITDSFNEFDIDLIKVSVKKSIDLNTQNLIFKGFQYANLTWSLSLTAQINWSNLPAIPESFYPINLLSTTDDIYILSYAERMNFYLTAVGQKNYWLQTGSMLKMQVEAKTDINEVINFIDNRI